MRLLPYPRLVFVSLAFLGCSANVSSQTLPDAHAFVLGLFQSYRASNAEPNFTGPGADKVFTPSLVALIRADQEKTPVGDVGTLNFDPICGCQDASYLSKVEVKVVDTGPGRALAVIHYRFPNTKKTASFDLESVEGSWRISDIHRRETPSLAKLLKDATD